MKNKSRQKLIEYGDSAYSALSLSRTFDRIGKGRLIARVSGSSQILQPVDSGVLSPEITGTRQSFVWD